MSNNRSEIQYVHGEKMKKLHSSNRGLTFSITPVSYTHLYAEEAELIVLR